MDFKNILRNEMNYNYTLFINKKKFTKNLSKSLIF